MLTFSSALHVTPESTELTINTTKDLLDAYPIDETAALNFLYGLGVKNETIPSMYRGGVQDQKEISSPMQGERFLNNSDPQLDDEDDNTFHPVGGFISETTNPLDGYATQKCLPFHKSFPDQQQQQSVQHSKFSGFSHCGFFRRRREKTQFYISSVNLATRGEHCNAQAVESDPYFSSSTKFVSTSSIKSPVPTIGLWHQAPFRKQKRTRHDRKVGVSFAELLLPSMQRFPSNCLADSIFENSREREILNPQKFGLSISMEPMIGSKKHKQQINEKFKREYPWVHSSITLSKLRNLKFDLFELIVKMPQLEPSTVAMAWTYFERLVARQVVHKTTRKLLAGACLVLAFKFNQALRATRLSQLMQIIQTLDRKDHLTPHDIFAVEFRVFAMIEFGMQLTIADIAPHLLEYFKRSEEKSFESEYGMTVEDFIQKETVPVSLRNASNDDDEIIPGLAF